MKFICLNETYIHYRIDGKAGKPRLVFINSLGTDFRLWDNVVEALSDHYEILRYDMRGHGLSGGVEDAFSIEKLSHDLLELLDFAQWKEDIVIVGLSVGGLIGQYIASYDPQRLKALVLMDTAAKIGTPASWEERIEIVRQKGLKEISSSIMHRWFTDNFKTKEPALYQACKTILEQVDNRGYAAICIALKDADLTKAISNIKMPVLVAVGQQDLSTPPEIVKATASLLEGAKYIEIADAGHLPCIEQPLETADILHSFVMGLSHDPR